MNNNEEWSFNTPKSYKGGRYIFNKWKLQDFMIMCICLAITFVLFVIFAINEWINIINGSIIISIFVIPLILFWPVQNYFNVITLIKTYLKYVFKRKEYKWSGIKYEED